MNMNFFNSETTPVPKKEKKARLPLMAVSFKAGLFSFNNQAGALLHLNGDSRIELGQDSENIDKWFLALNTQKGFPLRVKSLKEDTITGHCFNNTPLSRRIQDAFQISGKSCRLIIGDTPVKYNSIELWPLSLVPVEEK